jgi:hypothetical protein
MAFLYDLPTVMPFWARASFAIAAAFSGLTAVCESPSCDDDPEALAGIPQPVACVIGREWLCPARTTLASTRMIRAIVTRLSIDLRPRIAECANCQPALTLSFKDPSPVRRSVSRG